MKLAVFLNLRNRSGLLTAFLVIGLFIVSNQLGYAQETPEITQQLLEKLEKRDRKIAERDALIEDLQKRVEQLERLVGTTPPPSPSPQVKQPPRHPLPKPAVPAAQSKKPIQQAQAQEKLPEKKAKSSAPGTFEVDEDAAERALERTLTQVGALLLPFGLMEVQPFVVYSRREQFSPTLVLGESGQVLTRNAELRRNEFDAGFFTRFGLPFDSQLELSLPARVVDQTLVQPAGQVSFRETNDLGSSLGDITVGVAKTVFRERGWLPDLIARVTWDTDTSQRFSNGVALGGGFHEIRGSLTALKRQDPLAFTGNFFYESSFEKDNIDPGDKFGFSIGALLAASPATSLRLELQQVFSQELEVNGGDIPGSNQVSSSFIFGASSVLGRGILLSISGGIGLTEDAPDYFINFALPIRFGIPFR
ncbi:hypothetical protein Nhal_0134 [Nitrosococcus halophilus Nc 4]|uniref:Transporter n=1 Tax=Nitrosococcus halophilus (strain Nc4) TaxID=472759 RepID=D5C4S8_NITHN|nr:transporter [Nitrosococcus halophilus]ADE13351.1 hypothetical protein Nhal_0134 [Nitrosococcus halophilus Nc 4]